MHKLFTSILTKPRLITSRLVITFERRLACEASSTPPKSPGGGGPQGLHDFDPIYKFPHIVLVRSLCRLKLLQTGFTLTLVPVTGVLSYMDHVAASTFAASVGLSGLACLMLYAMSELGRRAVGAMYLHKREEVLRVAYLTFWGNRRDVLVPVSDVIPLADLSENPMNVYVKLCRYSDRRDVLYFTLRYGLVLDKEKFTRVFGHPDFR